MKTRASFIYLWVSVVAVIAGCTLDAPREFGEKCDNIAFIQANNEIMEHNGEHPSYDIYFERNLCPVSAPFCITIDEYDHAYNEEGKLIPYPEKHFCSDVREACPDGTHLFFQNCELDFPDQCGSHANNCIDPDKGVLEAECIDQKCVIKTCLREQVGPDEYLNLYALIDGECRTGDQCCGEYCKDCSRTSPQQVCYSVENLTTCGDGCPAPCRRDSACGRRQG